MNCKPGDLAVIVVGPNTGKTVQVIKGIGWQWTRFHDGSVNKDFWWKVDRPLLSADFCEVTDDCNDSILRPIRDPGDDAQDETLTWLPSPVTEAA